jgi:hypothetical protein
MIELRSLARGSKISEGREVKFGKIEASTKPRVEIKILPLLVIDVLPPRPKMGDHEWPGKEIVNATFVELRVHYTHESQTL